MDISKTNPSNHDNNANLDSLLQNIKSIVATLRIVIDQIGSGFEQDRRLIHEIAKQLDEGRPSNRMDSADKLKLQNIIPTTAGKFETIEENDDTIIAYSLLTIDDEYASKMPALSDLDYGCLKSSQEHGLHFPIVVNQDGVILDGHHRNKACRELGIKPTIIVRQFENRLQEKKFIIEVNLNRRYLNDFQRIELQIKLESIESELTKEHRMGTGTTAIAAIKLKRRFVGIEKDKVTLAIARHRISIASSDQKSVHNTEAENVNDNSSDVSEKDHSH